MILTGTNITTVKIGNREWMGSNLATGTVSVNGDSHSKSQHYPGNGDQPSEGAWSGYNNDPDVDLECLW
jgi:hypothetical protein